MTPFARLHLSRVRLAAGDPARAEDGFERVLRGAPGWWNARAETVDLGDPWGTRVRALTLVHGAHDPDIPIRTPSGVLSVDSGLFGFYDADRLPEIDEGLFDRRMIDTDARGQHAIAFDDMAAVARSGIGDGAYPLFVAINAADQIVAARAVFLATSGEHAPAA